MSQEAKNQQGGQVPPVTDNEIGQGEGRITDEANLSPSPIRKSIEKLKEEYFRIFSQLGDGSQEDQSYSNQTFYAISKLKAEVELAICSHPSYKPPKRQTIEERISQATQILRNDNNQLLETISDLEKELRLITKKGRKTQIKNNYQKARISALKTKLNQSLNKLNVLANSRSEEHQDLLERLPFELRPIIEQQMVQTAENIQEQGVDENLRNKAKNQEKQIEELRTNIRKVKRERNMALAERDEAKREITSLKKKITRLEEELNKKTQKVVELKSEAETTKKREKRLNYFKIMVFLLIIISASTFLSPSKEPIQTAQNQPIQANSEKVTFTEAARKLMIKDRSCNPLNLPYCFFGLQANFDREKRDLNHTISRLQGNIESFIIYHNLKQDKKEDSISSLRAQILNLSEIKGQMIVKLQHKEEELKQKSQVIQDLKQKENESYQKSRL